MATTVYNDHTFRSKFEAQWAFCLDHLEMEFQYEPRTHVLASFWSFTLVGSFDATVVIADAGGGGFPE